MGKKKPKTIPMTWYNHSSSNCLLILSIFFLIIIPSFTNVSGFVLEGSDTSYAKFRKWNGNSSLLLEFRTNQPDGLVLYTDDGGNDDFFELKLVEGSLRLRYNLGDGTNLINVGAHLNDGFYHKAEIENVGGQTSLTVDKFLTQSRVTKGRDRQFGNISSNSAVFVGGLPSWYNNRLNQLSLPSVVFEPRFRGAVRNLVYSESSEDLPRPQEIVEAKGLVSGAGEACERHDPCQHGGFCISTDNGPVCDCKHIDFQGAFCESQKPPAEATFHGGEYIGFDFRESGGESIVSTLDEVSFLFKTREANGLLFYTGDGADYLSISLRDGRITISINLGSGPLDAKIRPDHLKLDDNTWHSVSVNRKTQEITASLDGIYFERWTLAGSFSVLSSNRVAVGGYDVLKPLPGIRAIRNFIGCLRKVEYRADTLRLSLLELARAGNRLVTISGRLQFQCRDSQIPSDPISLTSDSYLKSLTGGTVTFTSPDSYLVLPSWNSSKSGSLSVKIRTTEANGLLLYANGEDQGDYFAIEMHDGQLYLHLDLGTGSSRIQATQDSIHDGEWHHLSLTRNSRSGTINVDDLATDFNTKGDSTSLDLDGLVYVGGLPNLDRYPVPIWTASLRRGFVGCVRALVLNGVPIDLSSIAQVQDIGSVRPLCQVGSAGHCLSNPCQNGGKCLDGWNRFICDCSHTDFTGPICSKSSSTVSFDATQHIQISYTTPVKVEAQDVTLRFRTNRPAGLFLWMGSNSSPDFIEISLEATKVKLRVRLGDREKNLITGQSTNDNNWHLVRVRRRGNEILIQVDDIPPVTGQVLSRTWAWPLTINTLYIGGGRPDSLFFAGHLQQLTINSQQIFEMIRSGQIENVEMTAKFGKSIPIVDKPVTFKSKHTFVGLPQLKAYSSVNIYFQFKTLEPDGLLLYNGGKSADFIAIELVKGHLFYLFDLGDGAIKLRDNSRSSLNDGRWHTVTIGRPNFKQHTLMVDETLSMTSSAGPNLNLDLNGVLYLGGVPENMYDTLARTIQSRYGFVGCLASLDLGGEAFNPTTDALVPSNMVVQGCEDSNQICMKDTCANGGICVEQWSGPGCDCDTTSFTGATCSQESISYDFGPGRGVILFTYPEERRPDTRSDSVAFGFLTADPDGVLLRLDSATSNDYLEIELSDGKVLAGYNIGTKDITIGELERRVNDRNYHVLRFTRAGANATLQLDNWEALSKYPQGNQLSVFNSQSMIHVGGRWKTLKRVVDNPYHGIISGLVVNGLKILDLATDRDARTRIVGDAHQVTNIGSPQANLKDDIRHMQKTTASGTPGVGISDDLIYSGAQGCTVDDEDECIQVVEPGSGDDLITPVYIPSPTRRPFSSTTTRRKLPLCDDEDCVGGSGAGAIPEETPGYTTDRGSISTIFYDPTNNNNRIHQTTTTHGGHSRYDPSTTTTRHTTSTEIIPRHTDMTTIGSTSTINNRVPEYRPTEPPQTQPTMPPMTTQRTPSTTRFVPPSTPAVTIVRDKSLFDFATLPPVISPPYPDFGNSTPTFIMDHADSTLIIIIIIAVLMIIIVSILIIFFMCKHKENPIYKIEEKGRYEFVAGGSGGAQGVPGNGRKKTVKEWYV